MERASDTISRPTLRVRILSMKKYPWLALVLFWLVAPAAHAVQQRARASLYTRVEGELVKAAIEIKVDSGWHLFHTELGGPAAVAIPLKLEWSGAAVGTWSEPRLPEPKVFRAPGTKESEWAWVHRGRFYVHALGRLVPGSDPNDIGVRLSGQTCMDMEGLCLQYAEEIETKGAGVDPAFAGFPADLAAPAASSDAAPSASAPPANDDVEWEPEFDSGKHADARAFLRIDGGQAELAIQVAIEEGFHLYHGPTKADIGGPEVVASPTTVAIRGGNIEWEPVVYPTPIELEQPGFQEGDPPLPYKAHEGSVVFHTRGKVTGEADPAAVRVVIEAQVCDDKGCLPYDEEVVPESGGPDALFALLPPSSEGAGTSAGPTSGAAAAGELGELSTMSLGAFLLLAVGWGIFTLLMPCTYPMIPITISFFTKQAIAHKRSVLPLSLLYGAGIVFIFGAIGVLAKYVGESIQGFAVHPITNAVIGVVFVVFALALFGAIDIRPPAFLTRAASRASQLGGLLGVFLMGATLVVTSFTCTAPFVGSLLAIGAAGGDPWRNALGMTVFGLTMAVPFVVLSLVPGKIQQMPTAGEWMHVLKVTLGFVELAAALKFLSNADIVWQLGLLSREVFLALWTAIFVAAAAFLFGMIHLKGENEHAIGPWRLLSGIGSLLLAFYFHLGIQGYLLDGITTAILPNYSSQRLWGSGSGGSEENRHEIVRDDLPAATARAREQGKLLLVNFTGFT